MRNIVNMSVYNAGMRNVSSMLPETETILHQFFLPFIKRLAHLLDDPRFLWNDLQPGSSATGYPSCQTIQDSRGTICSLPLQQQAASHARRSKIPVERFAPEHLLFVKRQVQPIRQRNVVFSPVNRPDLRKPNTACPNVRDSEFGAFYNNNNVFVYFSKFEHITHYKALGEKAQSK